MSDTQLNAEERARLEDEREFLLRSLEDLEREHEVGDVDDDNYASLKDGYVARAGAVLRALRQDQAPPPPSPPPAPEAPSAREDASASAGASPASAGASSAHETVSAATAASGGSQRPSPPSSQGESLRSGGSHPDPGRSDEEPVGNAFWGRTWKGRSIFGVAAIAIVVGVLFGVRAINTKPNQDLTVAKQQIAAASAAASGNGVQALKDYAKILKKHPDNVVAMTGEAELYIKAWTGTGNKVLFNQAYKALATAEDVDKTYAPAYGALGLLYYDNRDYADAVPQFVNYLNYVPAKSRNPEIVKALKDCRNKLAKGIKSGS